MTRGERGEPRCDVVIVIGRVLRFTKQIDEIPIEQKYVWLNSFDRLLEREWIGDKIRVRFVQGQEPRTIGKLPQSEPIVLKSEHTRPGRDTACDPLFVRIVWRD